VNSTNENPSRYGRSLKLAKLGGLGDDRKLLGSPGKFGTPKIARQHGLEKTSKGMKARTLQFILGDISGDTFGGQT
jgi:hypothetical protein